MAIHEGVTAVLINDEASSQHGDWKFPLMLSCLAGASTSVGAGIVFVFSPATIQQSMSFSLSLAASVMITVSVISIGPECVEGMMELDVASGSRIWNYLVLMERIGSFALGCGSYYLLSRLLANLPEPEFFVSSSAAMSPSKAVAQEDDDDEDGRRQSQEQPTEPLMLQGHGPTNALLLETSSEKHQRHRGAKRRGIHRDTRPLMESISGTSSSGCLESDDDDEDELSASSSFGNKSKLANTYGSTNSTQEDRRRSWRVALLLFISLLCHNFPEGLAVVASTAESRELGVTVTIGILIHNIPEGIAIAVPCMAARPDAPWLAFVLASVSGLAEPLGALLALTAFHTTHSLPMENILACVAGVMCMVAVVELYPEAYRHVRHRNFKGMVVGTVVGMVIMIATEWYMP